jgi:hypothetical protein
MPGTANAEWCEVDQAPAAICGGPHEMWRNPETGATATARAGQPVPLPGYTERVTVTPGFGQAEESLLQLAAAGHQTPAWERLDSAIAEGNERHRLASSALHAKDYGAAAAHCQAGILALLLAISQTLKEESA